MCDKTIIIFCAKATKLAFTAKFSDLRLTTAVVVSSK